MQKLYEIKVYMTKFYKDRVLKNKMQIPFWLIPIQAGASLTTKRVADLLDCDGENISCKNPNYCELTVLYWIWKNCLSQTKCGAIRYFGLFHYRRWLDISNDDWRRICNEDVDVVLPYPTVHEPNIGEHHTRYIAETDWSVVLQALRELAPDYYAVYERIFSQEYMYNYNMLIAREDVLARYCEWLFPILEYIEELSSPRGYERADRYIGYIGENLLTLYFFMNRDRLKIVHTGRLMLT